MSLLRFLPLLRDHPRIHGEHLQWQQSFFQPTGSPPHTRGTRYYELTSVCKHRITPAYTGNTNDRYVGKIVTEDHPRIHGEHKIYQSISNPARGSPPHTRGTRTRYVALSNEIRITPAYTGNTGFNTILFAMNEDHPRIHGEHLYKVNPICSSAGSPPHTRGTLAAIKMKILKVRITPAYTGNTHCSRHACKD